MRAKPEVRKKMIAGILVETPVLSHPDLSRVEMSTELSVNDSSGASNQLMGGGGRSRLSSQSNLPEMVSVMSTKLSAD